MKRSFYISPFSWVIFCLFTSSVGLGSTTIAEKSGKRFSSTTHFGYGQIRGSSTGHRGHGGSSIFLDINHHRSNEWRLGVRTVAEGSLEQDDSFHRLSTGPLVTWQINEIYALQGWFGIFSETAQQKTTAVYRSKGLGTMMSFRREFFKKGDLHLLWGGYFTYYRGNLKATANIAGQSFKQRHRQSENYGWSQGFTVSAQLPLN